MLSERFNISFLSRSFFIYISIFTLDPVAHANYVKYEKNEFSERQHDLQVSEPGMPVLPVQLQCPAGFRRVDVWSGFVSKVAFAQLFNMYDAYQLAKQHAEDKVARSTIHTIHNCEGLRGRHQFLISRSKFVNPGTPRSACRYETGNGWMCALRVSVEVACCIQIK